MASANSQKRMAYLKSALPQSLYGDSSRPHQLPHLPIASIRTDGRFWAAGAFHIYQNDHGDSRLHQTITPSDPREWQGFGRTVASDGTFLVASANGDQEAGPFAGAAYLFDVSEIIPTAVQVPLDFRPGNPRNVINPKKQGKFWVAVLSADNFDALQVAPETMALGPGAASPDRYRVKDVNRDRLPDLMLRFRTPEVGIQCRDTEVELTGETYAGDSIIGTDVVKTVGCEKPKNGKKKSKKVKKK